MKISAQDGDEGFEELQRLARSGARVDITLDGKALSNVLAADTEAGTVRLFDLDEAGKLIPEMRPPDEEFGLPTMVFRMKLLTGAVDILIDGVSISTTTRTTTQGPTHENHN